MRTNSELRINRFTYDLTKVVSSGYEPIQLDTKDEQISKIIQSSKAGRIFYSSYLNDFSMPTIKELKFDTHAEGFSKILSYFTGYQASNKRLKTINIA